MSGLSLTHHTTLRAWAVPHISSNAVVLACALGVIALSLFALSGWALNQLTWASFHVMYIPMAPNTALMFLALGGAVVGHLVLPATRWRRALIWLSASVCFSFSGFTLFQFFVGDNSTLSLLLYPRSAPPPPIGQTSPITAGLFLLSGAAALALAHRRKGLAAGLAVLVLVSGSVILIGYWYGAPFLYGSPIVPVALPTALAFVALGLGLIISAGPEAWPLNVFVGHSTQARLSRALLPAILLFILVEGWFDAMSMSDSSSEVARSTLVSLGLVVIVQFTIWRVSASVGRAVDRAVAERRQAEALLQKSRDSYMKLLEDFPALIWRSGRDAQCDYFNSAWLNFTGRRVEHELGSGWIAGVHPDDVDRCLAIYREAFERRQPFEMEYRLRHCGGGYRWILDMGRPFVGLDEQFAGYIGFCYDISDKKLRRSEEEAIAEERRRIAREIHDGLAQDLAALRVRVGLWHDLVDGDPPQMHAELDHLQSILRDNIREVRRSIFALRPVALEELGFRPALRQFIADFGEQNQLHMNLHCAEGAAAPPAALEAPLFRIIQETLHNTAKHAEAENIWIELDIQSDAAVRLTVRDDGQGFEVDTLEAAAHRGHLGLRQLRERIEDLHGHLEVLSAVGRGTTVRVTLPSVRV